MAIENGQKGRGPVVQAPSRLDAASAGGFHDELNAAIAASHSVVVVNMTGLDYISNAGLRVLVQAATKIHGSDGRLVLRCLSEDVRTVVENSGISRLLEISPSEEDAVVTGG